MALTFLFFIFSPSERKDYTLFDVNELCQRPVYRLWGQLLRRAAYFFFFFIFTAEKCKHSQHIQVQTRRIFPSSFLSFHSFVSSPHTERQPCAYTLISGSTFFPLSNMQLKGNCTGRRGGEKRKKKKVLERVMICPLGIKLRQEIARQVLNMN